MHKVYTIYSGSPVQIRDDLLWRDSTDHDYNVALLIGVESDRRQRAAHCDMFQLHTLRVNAEKSSVT